MAKKKSDTKMNVFILAATKDEFDQFSNCIKPRYYPIRVSKIKDLENADPSDYIVNLGDSILRLAKDEHHAAQFMKTIEDTCADYFPYCLEFVAKFVLSKITTDTKFEAFDEEKNKALRLKAKYAIK